MRPAAQSPIDARYAEMFPVLALSEIGRISRLGERRAYPAGARVFSTGEIAPGAFVLLSGQVDIMQRVGDRDAELIVSHGPGSFMGELAQLSGRPALVDGVARGPVEVVAFDQDNRRALGTGKLLLIDNVIDQSTATIRLKAMFPNEDEKLWPGEFVNARVLLDTRSNVLVIPPTAVQRGPQGLFTWLRGSLASRGRSS